MANEAPRGVRFVPPGDDAAPRKEGSRTPSVFTDPAWVESVVALAWDMGLARAPAGFTLDKTWRTEPDCGVRFVLRTDADTKQ